MGNSWHRLDNKVDVETSSLERLDTQFLNINANNSTYTPRYAAA